MKNIAKTFLIILIVIVFPGCSINGIFRDHTKSDISVLSNNRYIMDYIYSYDEYGHYKEKKYFLYDNKKEEVLINDILYYKIDKKNNFIYFIFHNKTIDYDRESLFILNYASDDYKIIDNIESINDSLKEKINKKNMIKP